MRFREIYFSTFSGSVNLTECPCNDACSELEYESHFFESADLKTLDNEEAELCEGLITIKECADALNKFQHNKTPGSDGLTIEFYRCF